VRVRVHVRVRVRVRVRVIFCYSPFIFVSLLNLDEQNSSKYHFLPGLGDPQVYKTLLGKYMTDSCLGNRSK
jgi:hypothetical protein